MAEWKHISEEFVAKFYTVFEPERPNFDHSLTVILAVHYGKTECLRYSKDPKTLDVLILQTTEAIKLMLPFRQ